MSLLKSQLFQKIVVSLLSLLGRMFQSLNIVLYLIILPWGYLHRDHFSDKLVISVLLPLFEFQLLQTFSMLIFYSMVILKDLIQKGRGLFEALKIVKAWVSIKLGAIRWVVNLQDTSPSLFWMIYD